MAKYLKITEKELLALVGASWVCKSLYQFSEESDNSEKAIKAILKRNNLLMERDNLSNHVSIQQNN